MQKNQIAILFILLIQAMFLFSSANNRGSQLEVQRAVHDQSCNNKDEGFNNSVCSSSQNLLVLQWLVYQQAVECEIAHKPFPPELQPYLTGNIYKPECCKVIYRVILGGARD